MCLISVKLKLAKWNYCLRFFDVSPMLDETTSMITPLIKKNNNRYSCEVCDEHITMCSDITRVKQVLFNLLANASKFTSNGDIKLKVELSGTDMIHFKVIDTGIGIEQKQIEKLFSEFVQADNSTTREFGGTGLGLAICRHLSRLMGGDITATSTLGTGSTFTVSLPLRAE